MFPHTSITRDFYRQHGKFSERAISLYWAKFNDLVKEAGCGPKAEPTIIEAKTIPIQDRLTFEREKLHAKQGDSKKLLDEALRKIGTLEQEREIILNLKDKTPQIYDIPVKVSKGESESVCFLIASDWHVEETVLPGDVSNLNEYNVDIAEQRAVKFFQGGHRLFEMLRHDTNIKTIVLALLGDFISNTLHEDQQETNGLLPAEAIYKAQNIIVNGIRFLLNNTPKDVELLIVCHSGNHGRMTKKQRHGAAEIGNSLEQFMYYNIRDFFQSESRVRFQIADGYHSYVRLFDNKYTIRFHHGHAIKYGGGIGGMSVPILKAVANWNRAVREVDMDVMGHFHQHLDGGNFLVNSSLIGYNSFAVSIKAAYEKPSQTFFLVNRKYLSKTLTTKIFVE